MEPLTVRVTEDKADTSPHQYSDRESKFIMTPIEEQKLELDACTEVASISAMVITKGRKIKVRKNRAKCLEMK